MCVCMITNFRNQPSKNFNFFDRVLFLRKIFHVFNLTQKIDFGVQGVGHVSMAEAKNFDELPPFEGDVEKIPQITRVNLYQSTIDGRWMLAFSTKRFTWVYHFKESSEKGRKQICSIFGIDSEEKVNEKMYTGLSSWDCFNLFNIEGKVVCVLESGGSSPFSGTQFVCEIKNPDAIPDKFVKGKYKIIYFDSFPKE
mgnify:CR=1 FL=1